MITSRKAMNTEEVGFVEGNQMIQGKQLIMKSQTQFPRIVLRGTVRIPRIEDVAPNLEPWNAPSFSLLFEFLGGPLQKEDVQTTSKPMSPCKQD